MNRLWAVALVVGWAGAAMASGDRLRTLATRAGVGVFVEAQDDRLVLQVHHPGSAPTAVRLELSVRCAADAAHLAVATTLAPGERVRRPWPRCPADATVQVQQFVVGPPAPPEPAPSAWTPSAFERALAGGLWGVRLAGGPSTVFKTEGLSYPDTGWLLAPALGATFDLALTEHLGVRGLAEFGVSGADLDAGAAGTGHLELWTARLGAAFVLRLGDPRGGLRPFVLLGPYASAVVLTRAELNGFALDADPGAPYRPLSWGLLTGTGAVFEAGGEVWSLDLRFDTGLRSIADPAYPAFARTPDETLRTTDVQLGLTWYWSVNRL